MHPAFQNLCDHLQIQSAQEPNLAPFLKPINYLSILQLFLENIRFGHASAIHLIVCQCWGLFKICIKIAKLCFCLGGKSKARHYGSKATKVCLNYESSCQGPCNHSAVWWHRLFMTTVDNHPGRALVLEQTCIANFVPLQNSHENMDKKCKHTDKHT